MAIDIYSDKIRDPKINLYEANLPNYIPNEVEQKAEEANYALGEDSPGIESLFNAFNTGNEQWVKDYAAQKQNLRLRRVRSQIADEFMEQKKGDVTNEDLRFVMGLTQENLYSPDSAIEEEFARRLVEDSEASDPSVLDDALLEDEESVYDQLDVAEFSIARNRIAVNALRELEAKARDRSFLKKSLDFVEGMLPFKWWWETQNVVDTKTPLTGFLPGENWEQQAAYLNLLHPKEFALRFRQAINDIAENNIESAIHFGYYVLSHSASDKTMLNLLGALDLTDAGVFAGAIGLTAKKSAKAALNISLRDTMQAASEKEISIANVVAATGDLDTAARIQSLKNIRSKVLEADPDIRGINLWNTVPSVMNPRRITSRSIDLAGEATRRLETALLVSSDLLQQAATRPVFANRLTELADEVAIDKEIKRLRQDFDHVNNSILDIEWVTKDKKSIGNVHSVEMKLGKPDATLFRTSTQANAYAERYGLPLGSYNVKQQGKRFYLSVIKDVNETDPDAINQLVIDSKNKTPDSLISQFIGWLRTPEDIVSNLSRANRHVTTHSSQEFNRFVGEVAGSVGRLSKKDRENLEGFLNANRDYHETVKDPKTGETFTKFGRDFNTLADFEKEWKLYTGAYPTERMAEAFFKFKQLSDFDYVIRNLNYYRDLARQGVARYQFPFKGQMSNDLMGKRVDFLPQQTDDAAGENPGILFVRENGDIDFFYRNQKNQDDITQLNSEIKDQNFSVLQIANPAERVFKEHGISDPVNFVVAKGFAHKPLNYDLIPYNTALGHVQYAQEHFIKQAIVTKQATKIGDTDKFRLGHTYEGDRSAGVFSTGAEAGKYTALMNQGRLLLDKEAQLRTFLKENLPFYSVNSFKKLFKETKDEAGNVIPPRFSRDEPFFAAFRNQSVGKAVAGTENELGKRYSNLSNLVESSYNLMKNVNKEFAGPRDLDLFTIKELPQGLRLRRAQKIDSLEMMTKAMHSLTKDRIYKDYQTQAVTSWIRQFGNALNKPLAELQKSPLHYFYNPPWDNSAATAELRAHAANNRRAIMTFLTREGELDKTVHMVQHKVLDKIYQRLGQKASDFASGFQFARIDNPIKFMRAGAFHAKLGLFNPVIIWTNSQTLLHSTAITGNPVRAGASLAGASLMALLRHNPAHINYFAKKAGKLGWQEDEFKEAFTAMRNVGYDNIEGELAILDDIVNPDIYRNGVSSWLNKGALFFKSSERMIRMNAWNIAWKEFRQRNPKTKITDREIGQILTRADDLALNMTRASNTTLQRGVWSIPLQFFSFQMRMMEQMLGKRLTRAEKARVFLMYSTMYGVPIATTASGGFLGGASGLVQGAIVTGGDPLDTLEFALKGAAGVGWTFYDDLREEGIRRGVELDQGVLEALSEGIPAVALEALFGNEYNGGERYGPGGIDILKLLIDGETSSVDDSFYDILGGVSGSLLEDIFKTLHPVSMKLNDVFSEEDTGYSLTLTDFTDPVVKNVSSLNNAEKMIRMLNTGRYISKNGTYLDDVDNWDAILNGVFGLSPRDVGDSFLMLRSTKDLRSTQSKARVEISKNIRKGLKAETKEDRDIYFRRAKAEAIAAGFLPTQYSSLIVDALDGNISLVDQVRHEFYTTKAPADLLEQRTQFYLNQRRENP